MSGGVHQHQRARQAGLRERPRGQGFLQHQVDVADGWKSITKRKPALPDAEEWKDKTDKVGELVR